MLARRLILVCVVSIILQNSFQVADGKMTSWAFRKALLEKLRSASKEHTSNNDDINMAKEVSLFDHLSSIWRIFHKKLDSIQTTEVKQFKPFFDGRFGR